MESFFQLNLFTFLILIGIPILIYVTFFWDSKSLKKA